MIVHLQSLRPDSFTVKSGDIEKVQIFRLHKAYSLYLNLKAFTLLSRTHEYPLLLDESVQNVSLYAFFCIEKNVEFIRTGIIIKH